MRISRKATCVQYAKFLAGQWSKSVYKLGFNLKVANKELAIIPRVHLEALRATTIALLIKQPQ